MFRPVWAELLLLGAAAAVRLLAQAPVPPPISRDRLFQALDYRALTPQEILERVRTRGVAFKLSDPDWQSLLKKGTSSKLIAAIRESYRTEVPPPASVESSPWTGGTDLLTGPPLSQTEVLQALKATLPLPKLLQAIALRGAGFLLTPKINRELWEAGGNLTLSGELLLSSRTEQQPLPADQLFAEVETAASPRAAVAAPAPTAFEPPKVPPQETPLVPSSPAAALPSAGAPPVPGSTATPPAAAMTPARVEIASALQALKLIHRVLPTYPPAAASRRLTGQVRLRVTIGEDGKVQATEVIHGEAIFLRAAQDAVQQWVYRPTIINEQTVEVVTEVDLTFRPQ